MDGDRIVVSKLKTPKDFYLDSVSSNLEEWLSDKDEEAWSNL